MTFTQFLQVLAFNLLSNTIPLCLLLILSAYLIAKMFEKRFDKVIEKRVNKIWNELNPNSRKRASADED